MKTPKFGQSALLEFIIAIILLLFDAYNISSRKALLNNLRIRTNTAVSCDV